MKNLHKRFVDAPLEVGLVFVGGGMWLLHFWAVTRRVRQCVADVMVYVLVCLRAQNLEGELGQYPIDTVRAPGSCDGAWLWKRGRSREGEDVWRWRVW